MRSSEFLRGHYDHTENTTLLEVLPWKQDIKRKFLSPFSRIFKTCAENPVALSQSKVTSVWSRLFLLKTATQGWLLRLPTGHTILPSNHPQTGCTVHCCIQSFGQTHSPDPQVGGERIRAAAGLLRGHAGASSWPRRPSRPSGERIRSAAGLLRGHAGASSWPRRPSRPLCHPALVLSPLRQSYFKTSGSLEV